MNSRRLKSLCSLADVVGDEYRAFGRKSGSLEQLQRIWPQRLPKEIAHRTRPISVSREELKIEILDTLSREALEALQNESESLMNQYAVTKITYIRRLSHAEPVQHQSRPLSNSARAKTADIGDHGLRQAMAALITSYEQESR